MEPLSSDWLISPAAIEPEYPTDYDGEFWDARVDMDQVAKLILSEIE